MKVCAICGDEAWRSGIALASPSYLLLGLDPPLVSLCYHHLLLEFQHVQTLDQIIRFRKRAPAFRHKGLDSL